MSEQELKRSQAMHLKMTSGLKVAYDLIKVWLDQKRAEGKRRVTRQEIIAANPWVKLDIDPLIQHFKANKVLTMVDYNGTYAFP